MGTQESRLNRFGTTEREKAHAVDVGKQFIVLLRQRLIKEKAAAADSALRKLTAEATSRITEDKLLSKHCVIGIQQTCVIKTRAIHDPIPDSVDHFPSGYAFAQALCFMDDPNTKEAAREQLERIQPTVNHLPRIHANTGRAREFLQGFIQGLQEALGPHEAPPDT